MTWKCEMGAKCGNAWRSTMPHELQWSGSGLDTNKGFYCLECVQAFDIPIAPDAPFLSDILDATKVATS